MDLFNSRLLVLYICVCVCVCVQAFGFGLLVVEQHVYSARIRIQDEQTIGTELSISLTDGATVPYQPINIP